MSTAPLVSAQLIAIGQTLMIGVAAVLSLFVLLGAAAYVCCCLRSCRRYNGIDQRWERPA